MADAAESQGRNPTFADVLAGVRDGGPPRPPNAADPRDGGGPPSRAPTAADALNRLLSDAPPAEANSGAPSVRPFRPAANQPIAKLGVRQVNADPRFEQRPDLPRPDLPRPEMPQPQRFQPPPVDPRAMPWGSAGDGGNRPEQTRMDPRRRAPQRPNPPRPQLSDPETEFWQESPMPVEATATVEKPRTPDQSERLAGAYNPHPAPPAAAQAAERAAPAAERTVAERPAAVAVERPAVERPAAEKPERQAALGRRLQSLGVPTDIAFRATAADTYTAVVDAFSALPVAEAAPDGPGETLIVVGESTHAVEVARWVAEAQRLDTSHILFAGRNAAAAGIEAKRRITGAHDARLWAKKLRKSDAPSVVAVEAALDESAWAAAIVEAVRPVAVWVVVDASRKTSDVAHHLQGLRRVDAICLRGTMSSGDPASPLSLRLPVALLDGRPSTPFQWAAMLCERLSLVGG
ncbi:hypothetical protein AB0K00_38950 [Dactylosporangium sp. NPDC049525]|uniref:hypothetical protein n=1 Tax=Dactylosporangium sp. NPDC049525 TaxID=3154730 RepID=UPI0034403A36